MREALVRRGKCTCVQCAWQWEYSSLPMYFSYVFGECFAVAKFTTQTESRSQTYTSVEICFARRSQSETDFTIRNSPRAFHCHGTWPFDFVESLLDPSGSDNCRSRPEHDVSVGCEKVNSDSNQSTIRQKTRLGLQFCARDRAAIQLYISVTCLSFRNRVHLHSTCSRAIPKAVMDGWKSACLDSETCRPQRTSMSCVFY
jgi:hypothetical protein